MTGERSTETAWQRSSVGAEPSPAACVGDLPSPLGATAAHGSRDPIGAECRKPCRRRNVADSGALVVDALGRPRCDRAGTALPRDRTARALGAAPRREREPAATGASGAAKLTTSRTPYSETTTSSEVSREGCPHAEEVLADFSGTSSRSPVVVT